MMVEVLSLSSTNTIATIVARIGVGSELIEAAKQVARRPDNILGLLLRNPTREEIAIMEARGCRADDWTLVQVAEDFDAFRVRRTHLVGRCVLGRFTGEVEVMPGVRLPAGVYGCTLVDCHIANDCLLENVRFAASVVVEREAVLFDVGSITCSGAATFGCGQELRLAVETGGRELPLWAEADVSQAAVICRERGDREGQAALRNAVAAYVAAVRSPVAWVRRRAVVRHTERLRDAYIGGGAIVDHALELDRVAVLSSVEERVVINGGAAVRDSVVQWGAQVSGGAIVRHALLCEHSAVDANGMVEHSLIGPNTAISKGEVTSSLVGPFVGFHHQSMLIAAYWPEGKGNIAYGAMVGSNHTGRAPDQEVWPGEGAFFGLGCAVRLPADFSQSPYLVIAAGTSLLPQRLSLPFALVSTPAEPIGCDEARVPRAFNEVLPGWGLYANAYAIERVEAKFAARDRAKRQAIDYKVLRPEVVATVRDALARLEGVTEVRGIYLDTDIPGLGKNFLRESARLAGIEAYRRVLLRYCLRVLLGEAEGRITIPGSAELAHELADQLQPNTDLRARMAALLDCERRNAELVLASKAADDDRGVRIIPGYADAHVAAGDDPVVARARERLASTEARIQALGLSGR